MLIIKKGMGTFLQGIYYDLSGKNISLEGRHLVWTLLASIQELHVFSPNMEKYRIKAEEAVIGGVL